MAKTIGNAPTLIGAAVILVMIALAGYIYWSANQDVLTPEGRMQYESGEAGW